MGVAMMSCGDDADEQKVHFINSIPASGSEIAADETLVLSFDHPPGTVTVNQTSTIGAGQVATWKAQGLTPGQQVELEVQWDTGQTTLTFHVKAEDHPPPVDHEPPFVVEVTLPLSRCHLLYTEQVKLENGQAICEQGGLFFCGIWPSDLPGLEDRFDLRPSLEVPFEPALKYDDTLVVDTWLLNIGGIAIKFSEPIQKGIISTQIKETGRAHVVHVDWRYDSVRLLPLKAEFPYDTNYVRHVSFLPQNMFTLFPISVRILIAGASHLYSPRFLPVALAFSPVACRDRTDAYSSTIEASYRFLVHFPCASIKRGVANYLLSRPNWMPAPHGQGASASSS